MSYNPSLRGHEVRAELIERVAALPVDPIVSMFCTMVSSSSRDENYPITGGPPRLEEFEGEINVKSMSDGNVNLINREFAAGASFRIADLEDDKAGGYKLALDDFSAEIAEQKRAVVLEALVGNASGYDGAAFFADSHPIRGEQTAVQDNNLAGTGATTANVVTDLASAITALMTFRDEGRRIMNKTLSRLGIIAPPALRRPILEAVKEGALISNTLNAQVEGLAFTVAFAGELADTNDWYLFNLSKPLKPFLFQSRMDGEITDEVIKSQRKHAFYMAVRNAAMLTKWHLGVRTVNS